MRHRTQRRTLVTRAVPVAAVAAAVLMASAAHAGDPEQACQKGRYDAAAKYALCQQKLMGKYFAGSCTDYTGKFLPALSKCRVKYTDTWAKLQAKAQAAPTGETCDAARFVDNGDGTVTDNLTGLRWEKKQNLDSTQRPPPWDVDKGWGSG